jgi:DNA-binding NarL/FixJ family response regulator
MAEATDPITILIADDHKIVREGLKALLKDVPDLEVVGEAEHGKEAYELVEQVKPDLILMDISMGDFSGLRATELCRKKFPEVRILVLSMHADATNVQAMLEAGAAGYLVKTAGPRELVNAIRTVAQGDTYFSKEVSEVLMARFTQKNAGPASAKDQVVLTTREKEVLQLIAEEYTNTEIAKRLFISVRTVDTHRRNLLEKLKLKNNAGLVKYALKIGLIQ